MTRPKNPREEWNALVDYGASADLDAIAEMSEAEVDAQLAKAGFDVEAETRKGREEHERSVVAAPRRPVAPRRPARPSPWLAAPAALLVAVGNFFLWVEPLVMVGGGTHSDTAVGDGGARDAGPDR